MTPPNQHWDCEDPPWYILRLVSIIVRLLLWLWDLRVKAHNHKKVPYKYRYKSLHIYHRGSLTNSQIGLGVSQLLGPINVHSALLQHQPWILLPKVNLLTELGEAILKYSWNLFEIKLSILTKRMEKCKISLSGWSHYHNELA